MLNLSIVIMAALLVTVKFNPTNITFGLKFIRFYEWPKSKFYGQSEYFPIKSDYDLDNQK